MKKAMLLATAGMILLLVACASSRGVQVGSQAVDRAVAVQVHNENTSDMDVYAMSGGQFVRLGTVTAMSSDTLSLPATAVQRGSDLRLLADPIGGFGAYLSDPVLVSTGDVIVMRIGTDLAQSSVITQ